MGGGHPILDVYSFPAQTMGPPPSVYRPPPHPLDSYPHAVQNHTPQCGFCGFCGVTTAFQPGAPPHLTFGTGGTTMGGSGSWGGGNAANGGVVNALARGGKDQQHPESGKNEGTAENQRLRNRAHARRLRVRKRFMLDNLHQQVRALQDEHSTLRVLVQNVSVYDLPSENVRTPGEFHSFRITHIALPLLVLRPGWGTNDDRTQRQRFCIGRQTQCHPSHYGWLGR